jgi:3-methylfumaryl-CoA hydratase
VNATAPDLDHLRQWIGREREDEDTAAVRHARLMAATVSRPGPALEAGDALPPLWHWIYFLEGVPPAELGRDGHPARGAFLPPVPLANRMWAGGRVEFDAPVPLGASIRRRSRILSVDAKQGRSGPLVFVTVRHEVFASGARCIAEEHDIVYRDPPPPGGSAAPASENPEPGAHRREIEPDTTLLFRYSALTFNGHRIHYDLDYCRKVEGYANLVIHGPLVATLLAGFAQEMAGKTLRRFEYRALKPAILGTTLTFEANHEGGRADAWCRLAEGGVSMRASAFLAP